MSTAERKPDRIFRLNMGLIPTIPAPPDGKRAVEIRLPATDEQIESALDMLDACGLDDIMSAILDGPLPALQAYTFFGIDVGTVNDLAEQIQDMSDKELGILKALMEVVGPTTLDGVVELARQTGEYIIQDVEQMAGHQLNTTPYEKDAGLLKQYLNLYAYNKALLQQDNTAATHYEQLLHGDDQTIHPLDDTGSQQGGMEVTM